MINKFYKSRKNQNELLSRGWELFCEIWEKDINIPQKTANIQNWRKLITELAFFVYKLLYSKKFQVILDSINGQYFIITDTISQENIDNMVELKKILFKRIVNIHMESKYSQLMWNNFLQSLEKKL